MHSPNRLPRIRGVLSLFAVVLLVAGCGIFSPDETKDDTGGGGNVTFVPSTTRDLVMENFENAWETMNHGEYTKLLSTDFQFYFAESDNLDEYVGGPSWGRQDEEESTLAMFSNQPGYDPVNEEVIPPILGIQFETFTPLDPSWQSPPNDPLYEGTLRKRYIVSIIVTYQGDNTTTRVTGENWFYVMEIGRTAEDEPLYGIKVWEDKGQNIGT